LPIPGADRLHVFTLRNPNDAAAIRRTIDEQKPRTAAVIGSGFIGLEMVENLVSAGLQVTLLEKLPQVCPLVDPDMAPYIRQYLQNQQVRVLTGCTVTAIEQETVMLSDGERVPADLVILAVGVRPNVSLAREAGITLGQTGAIAVNEKMQTSCPDIYACGDCAEVFLIVDGRPAYRPLGSTANKMGRIAGDVVSGGCLTFRGVAGTGIFRVFELNIAACGLTEAQARAGGNDVVVCHNIKPDKPTYFGGREMVIKAIADRQSEKLLGVQIIGYDGVDKRIDVFVTAMTAGLTVSDLFHLDLAYAPPFATTKDPVLYTGMILDNAIRRGRDLITSDRLAALAPETVQIVDARAARQFEAGHVAGAVSMPHETLREHMAALDPDIPVVTYCNKGTTGNAAQNILLNRGFKTVYNLSGGHQQNKMCRTDKQGKKE
jgi:NADPH-dependent 2,4-dienoyl-CoA reductase/sulfur reductase-like enzyme/rhodanese-related sulfurtransferase